MTILFSAAPWAYGNAPLGLCIEVAKNARRRGHRCLFISSSRNTKRIESLGFKVVGLLGGPGAGEYPMDTPIYFSDFLAAGGLDNAAFVRELMLREAAIVRRAQPDVIFSVWHVTLHVRAITAGIPVVSPTFFPDHPSFISSHSIPRRQTPGIVERILNMEMKELGIADGIDFASDLIFRPPTTPVSLFPVGFDHELHTHAPQVVRVGAVVNVDDDAEAGTDPLPASGDSPFSLVYVPEKSASEWLFSDEVTRVLAAAAPPVIAPAMVGWNVPRGWTRPTATFHALLRRCSVLVCHGGFGSILAALSFGRPVICIPGPDPERNYVSAATERVGCGVTLHNLEPNALREALSRVQGESIRIACRAMADQIRNEKGTSNVVDMLERMARQYRSGSGL